MTKRSAPNELDYLGRNLNNESDDESDNITKEFKKASEEALRQRVFKVAKRSKIRQSEAEINETPMSIFNNFKGFQKSDDLVSSTSVTPNMFGFLSKISHSQPQVQSDVIDGTSNNNNNNNNNQRLAKIKGLNQSVADWIKMHVDKNPICDLNPIFDDYKKYWNEIENESSKINDSMKKIESKPITEIIPNEPAKKINFFSMPLSNQSTVSVNNTLMFPTIKPTNTDNEMKGEDNNDEDDIPPEPQDNFDSIKEDGSIIHMKSKIYFMENGSFKEKGVGYVFLKAVNNESNKLQLIARMNNKLGTIIMNTVLTSSMPPVQKRNDTNMIITCVPNAATSQTPIPVLFRVKNSVEMNEFIAKLNENLQ